MPSSGSTKVPIWKLLLSFPHLPPCWSAQVQVLFLPSPSSKFLSLAPYYILPAPPLYPSAMWTLSIFWLPYKERGQPLFLVVVMDTRTLLPRKPQGTSQKQPAVSLYGNCENEPMAINQYLYPHIQTLTTSSFISPWLHSLSVLCTHDSHVWQVLLFSVWYKLSLSDDNVHTIMCIKKMNILCTKHLFVHFSNNNFNKDGNVKWIHALYANCTCIYKHSMQADLNGGTTEVRTGNFESHEVHTSEVSRKSWWYTGRDDGKWPVLTDVRHKSMHRDRKNNCVDTQTVHAYGSRLQWSERLGYVIVAVATQRCQWASHHTSPRSTGLHGSNHCPLVCLGAVHLSCVEVGLPVVAPNGKEVAP